MPSILKIAAAVSLAAQLAAAAAFLAPTRR
jgi:hypothetical protein